MAAQKKRKAKADHRAARDVLMLNVIVEFLLVYKMEFI